MHRTIEQVLAVVLLTAMLAGCGVPGSDATTTPTPYPFITATPQPQPAPAPQTPEPTAALLVETPTDTPPPPPAESSPAVAGDSTPTATATPRPGMGCRYQPLGVFAPIYQNDPGLPPSLGCTTGQTPRERPRLWTVTIDFQSFERGHMLWVSNVGWARNKSVFVMLDDHTFSRYEDTFNPSEETPGAGSTPPGGLLEPVGALGKVWRTQPGLTQRIGFAVAQASHVETQMQMFEYGQMIHVPPSGQVVVLKQGQPGSWSIHAVNQ